MNTRWTFTAVGIAAVAAGTALWLANRPPAMTSAPAVAPAALLAASFVDAEGRRQPLGRFQGKLVVLNFWATWCVPCREELPALERLWRLRKDRGLAVIAVAIGEEPAAVRRFVDRLRPAPTFPIGLDRDKSVAKAWKVRGLPTTVLVGRDGRAAFAAAGAVAFDSPATLELLDRLGEAKI